MVWLLLKGLILGFSIAAPVGPIGLLCMRRALAEGRMSGFVSGLGAATADGSYALVAAFGLTSISNLLLWYQWPIKIIGATFLFYIAIKTVASRPTGVPVAGKAVVSLYESYFSTVFLTLTNPMTIISFIVVFAGLGVGSSSYNYGGAVFMVLGVSLGSALWWLLLSSLVGLLHHKISDNGMVWINRVSGILMFSLGVIALIG